MTLEATSPGANYGSTASGSSFYAAMRILPHDQREAMFQIYSFCRQVDDIADSDGPREERLAARNALLLDESRSLSADVADFRLGVDISVIQAYADRIVRLLRVRDPLRERVHLNKLELLTFSLAGIAGEIGRRAIGRKPAAKPGAAHDA